MCAQCMPAIAGHICIAPTHTHAHTPTPDVAKWGDLYKHIVEGLYLTNANVLAVFPWELNIVYNDKCLYLHTFLS